MIRGFLSTVFVIHIGILWIGCSRDIVTKSNIIYQNIEGIELSLDLYFSKRRAAPLNQQSFWSMGEVGDKVIKKTWNESL